MKDRGAGVFDEDESRGFGVGGSGQGYLDGGLVVGRVAGECVLIGV